MDFKCKKTQCNIVATEKAFPGCQLLSKKVRTLYDLECPSCVNSFNYNTFNKNNG